MVSEGVFAGNTVDSWRQCIPHFRSGHGEWSVCKPQVCTWNDEGHMGITGETTASAYLYSCRLL